MPRKPALPPEPSDRTLSAVDALAETWALLDKHRAEIRCTRTPGGITIEEYCEKYGVSKGAARGQLEKLVKDGVLVCEPTRVFRCGQSRQTNVYAPRGH